MKLIKKIRTFLVNVAKKNTVFRKFARNLNNYLKGIGYKKYYYKYKINDKTILLAIGPGNSSKEI